MIKCTLQPKALAIDTSEIWNSLCDNVKGLDPKLVWDYKYSLQASFLANENLKPEASYDWKNWRYYKGKYDSIDKNFNWDKPSLIQHIVKNVSVDNIIPVLSKKYKIQKDNFKQSDYNLLKDEDKIEFILGTALNNFDYIHPFPKDDNSISDEFKRDVVNFFDDLVNYERISQGGLSILFKRRDYPDPLIWLEVGYDVYRLSQKQHLIWDDSDDFFLESLMWFLIFLDPKYSKKAYLNDLCSNNNKTIEWLFATVKLLKLKFAEIIKIIDLGEKLNLIETYQSISIENISMKKATNNVSTEKTKGRPPKTFLINAPIDRNDYPDATAFTMEDTAAFFQIFRKFKIIINDKNIQSNLDLAKLISCQTGFSEKSLQRELSKSKITKDKLTKIRDHFSEFIRLINRDL